MFFRPKCNAGWRGDKPTEFVIWSFNKRYLKPGDKVLDVGSGFGRNSNWLASKGLMVTGININKNEIRDSIRLSEKHGTKVEYLHANAINLPFNDELFDSVLDLGCSHMLSANLQVKAEKEAFRVLKPGGYLIYFGFSKKHPVYKDKPKSSQFRDLNDLYTLYGEDFNVISSKETCWKPIISEKANFPEHIGLNIVMQKKTF